MTKNPLSIPKGVNMTISDKSYWICLRGRTVIRQPCPADSILSVYVTSVDGLPIYNIYDNEVPALGIKWSDIDHIHYDEEKEVDPTTKPPYVEYLPAATNQPLKILSPLGAFLVILTITYLWAGGELWAKPPPEPNPVCDVPNKGYTQKPLKISINLP